MQKIELIEKWQCPLCDKWYADDDEDLPNFASDGQEAAEKCCTADIDSRYFCPICNESFWRFQDGEDHLKIPHAEIEHKATAEEVYLDELYYPSGKYPIVAEWAIAMELDAKETERGI